MRSEEERQILQPSDKLTLSGQDGSKTPIGKLCILFLHVDKDVYFFSVLLKNCATDVLAHGEGDI